jgi:hypothetical protein
MAHQTSTIQRKHTTPHPIGRLMDADFSGSILPRCIQIRWTWAFPAERNLCYRREREPGSCNYQKTLGTDGSENAVKHPRELLLNPY